MVLKKALRSVLFCSMVMNGRENKITIDRDYKNRLLQMS